MKKSMKIFSVLMALALVLTLGGCRLWDEAKNSLGPTNKWVRCDFEYQVNDSTNATIHCYMIYSDGNYTNTDISTNLPDTTLSGGKLVKGLTIVLAPDLKAGSDASFASLFGVASTDKKYVLTTFADGLDVELDGASAPFKMGYTTWIAIYSSIETAQCGLPVALNKDANYSVITDLKSFQWKKLLAQMAFAKLTPYLEN